MIQAASETLVQIHQTVNSESLWLRGIGSAE